MRVAWTALIFLLVLCRVGAAQTPEDTVSLWADRLLANSNTVLRSEELEDYKKLNLCTRAVYALSLSGLKEEAISLPSRHANEHETRSMLLTIADGLSTADSVAAAFEAADKLSGQFAQRARALIAIRQSQRGDLDDALTLLDRIGDPAERSSARRIVIDELLEADRLADAVSQYTSLTNAEDREETRQSMQRHIQRVEPGDANYAERTIELTRRWRRRWGNFSERDAQLLRYECQARVAMHLNDDPGFREAIEKASSLVDAWGDADRCVALLSLGAICRQQGDREVSRDFFRDALGMLLSAGRVGFEDAFYRVHFALAAGDRFEAVVDVLPDAELRAIAKGLVKIEDGGMLEALGRGVGANGRHGVGGQIYQELSQAIHRLCFSSGFLAGSCNRRLRRPPVTDRGPSDKEAHQKAIEVIGGIVAEKPPLVLKDDGEHRPQREFLGLYNVSKDELPDYTGERWCESPDLPNLTLDEFLQVRVAVVSALWSHGSVHDFPPGNRDSDFFVWDDKFSDRTQKVEITNSAYLPELLAPAVAAVQRALADHPRWRVMFLADGANDKDQFFVVYPDKIRILQAENTESIADAIRANAVVRAAGE